MNVKKMSVRFKQILVFPLYYDMTPESRNMTFWWPALR
jgi:hypothetical protein